MRSEVQVLLDPPSASFAGQIAKCFAKRFAVRPDATAVLRDGVRKFDIVQRETSVSFDAAEYGGIWPMAKNDIVPSLVH